MSIIYSLPIVSQYDTKKASNVWMCWLVAPSIIKSRNESRESYKESFRVNKYLVGDEYRRIEKDSLSLGLSPMRLAHLYYRLGLQDGSGAIKSALDNAEVFYQTVHDMLRYHGPMVLVRPAFGCYAIHAVAFVGIIKTEPSANNASGIQLVFNESMTEREELIGYEEFLEFYQQKSDDQFHFFYKAHNNNKPQKNLDTYKVIDEGCDATCILY